MPPPVVRDAPAKMSPNAIVAEADNGTKPGPAAEPRPPDLRRLSPAEVREQGAEVSRLIESGHRFLHDPAMIRRLEGLAGHLAADRSGPVEPIRFHVLDSNDVNAFSHIGGHVYVSRGIFALAQTDAELEFVIAHERAHAELWHAAARLDSVVRQAGGPIGLAPAIVRMIGAGYTAEQEFEADERAYQALRRSGRSHRQSIGFLRRYAAYAEAHPIGRPAPGGEARQDVENHYAAHPPAGERLRRLEERDAPANAGRGAARSPR